VPAEKHCGAGKYTRVELAHNDFKGTMKRFYRRFEPMKRTAKFHAKSLYTQPVFADARAEVDVVLADASQNGIHDFQQLDYFSVAAQQSRRLGGGQTFYTCYPLARVDFLYMSYQLSPRQRLEDKFHRDLIGQIYPALADLRFGHEIDVPKTEIRRDGSRFDPIFGGALAANFEEILAQPDNWNDTFSETAVRLLRDSNYTAINEYQADRRMWQLAWRAAISMYVANVNDYIRSNPVS